MLSIWGSWIKGAGSMGINGLQTRNLATGSIIQLVISDPAMLDLWDQGQNSSTLLGSVESEI